MQLGLEVETLKRIWMVSALCGALMATTAHAQDQVPEPTAEQLAAVSEPMRIAIESGQCGDFGVQSARWDDAAQTVIRVVCGTAQAPGFVTVAGAATGTTAVGGGVPALGLAPALGAGAVAAGVAALAAGGSTPDTQ